MIVLVDTSIWIEYFKSGNFAEKLDRLIDENLVVINDLILAEGRFEPSTLLAYLPLPYSGCQPLKWSNA